MTDARLPGEWLNSIAFDDLSDLTWRVFTSSLMWCAQNGTDGHVPVRYLRQLHPDGEQPQAHAQLVAAGLWVKESAGYYMPEWDGSLHQSTAAEVQTYKAAAAKRSREYRERQRQKLAKTAARESSPASANSIMRDATGDVTNDVSSEITHDVGKAKAKANAKYSGHSRNEETAEFTSGGDDGKSEFWPVVSIPGERTSEPSASNAPTCRLCGQASNHLDRFELCQKVTPDHQRARKAA